MDDLRVEIYETKEVEAKKRSIQKRVAVAGCAGCATGLVLALFGLALLFGPMLGSVGGSGSWFFSTVEEA